MSWIINAFSSFSKLLFWCYTSKDNPFIYSLENGRSWAHSSLSASREIYIVMVFRGPSQSSDLVVGFFPTTFQSSSHFQCLVLSFHGIIAVSFTSDSSKRSLLWGFPAQMSYVLVSSSYRGRESTALHVLNILSRWQLMSSFSPAILFLEVDSLLMNGKLGSSPAVLA